MNVKLIVNGKQIELNEFAAKILAGTITGAITSLRDVKKDWTEVEIRLSRAS